jgi:hypothetical protein
LRGEKELMEPLKYINEAVVIFKQFQDQFDGEVIPCTQEQVDELESLLPSFYCLPAAYKEFLLYGGRKMGQLFEGGFSRDILKIIQVWNKESQLPPDIFVLTQHLTSYFDYFKLTEGENPPVYTWNEEDEGGLEVIKKEYDSFSDYLKEQIRVCAIELMPKFIEEKLQAKTPPRGKQFWIPTNQEQVKGIELPELMRYLGLYTLKELDEAASLCGLDPNQYLEELSGWKCYSHSQMRIHTRFFPPKG